MTDTATVKTKKTRCPICGEEYYPSPRKQHLCGKKFQVGFEDRFEDDRDDEARTVSVWAWDAKEAAEKFIADEGKDGLTIQSADGTTVIVCDEDGNEVGFVIEAWLEPHYYAWEVE